MESPVKMQPAPWPQLWKAELREIALLAGPIAISNFFGVFMQLTDLAFIGHLGADALAAAALGALGGLAQVFRTQWMSPLHLAGNTLFNLLYYCIVGAATVIDTYASQAFGSRNKWLVGMYVGTKFLQGLQGGNAQLPQVHPSRHNACGYTGMYWYCLAGLRAPAVPPRDA